MPAFVDRNLFPSTICHLFLGYNSYYSFFQGQKSMFNDIYDLKVELAKCMKFKVSVGQSNYSPPIQFS